MRAKVTYLFVFLFLTLAGPAEARITLGVIAGSPPFGHSERQLGALGDYLEQQLGEKVRVRLFREKDTLHDWLSRFREVDFALIDAAFVKAQPQGEFLHVADFQPLGRRLLAPDVFIARQGLPRHQVQSVHDVLTSMADDPEGRRVLNVFGVERFLAAGGSLPRSHDFLSPPKTTFTKQAASAPSGKKAAKPAGATKSETAPDKPDVQNANTFSEPTGEGSRPEIKAGNDSPEKDISAPSPQEAGQVDSPREKRNPTGTSVKVETEEVSSGDSANAPPSEALADPAAKTLPAEKPGEKGEPRIWLEESVPPAKALRAPEQSVSREPGPASTDSPAHDPARGAVKPEGKAGSDEIPPARKLVDALMVLCAVGATGFFFHRRRAAARNAEDDARKPVDQRDDEDYIHITDASLSGGPSAEPGVSDSATKKEPSAVSRERRTEAAHAEPRSGTFAGSPPAPADLQRRDEKTGEAIELKGTLDLFQVSSLLQMIASYPRPGTLVIHSPHDSKRIHFRLGKVAQAVSINHDTGSQAGFLMNKLGYLLIRMGMITEKERDQALEICEKKHRRRIGEVLVEMDALSRDDLKRALRTQAEGVIFSLFLFPEGRFELIHENLDIPAEDDLGLRVQTLLDEAARHEEEWSGLRDTIPSLDTILDYSDEGRDKLASARMTAHQQLVLSLIDGRRNLKDICREATMLDFEVYKFVYLMVRANILQPAGTG